jgi:urease subunit gamma/beta
MALTPGEHDRLLLFTQAQLARARAARGLKLNVPEATAFIADAVCEWARDGKTLAEVRELGRGLLAPSQVLPEVPGIVTQILVEARFDDGTRLVVIQNPFGDVRASSDAEDPVYLPPEHARVEVVNMAQTAIGITSHIHMAEVNPRLRLDRSVAYGMRPAHATGVTLWLEAGESAVVPLTRIEGERVMIGNTGVIDGPLDDPEIKQRALATLRECGYLDIVDGAPHNDVEDADSAVARLMGRA